MSERTYSPPVLSAKTKAELAQGAFDFLMPPGNSTTVTPHQCKVSLGREIGFVYDMIAEGRLETLAPCDREKTRHMVTRRSLALLICEQMQTSPEEFLRRVIALLQHMDRSALTALLIAATERRARL